MRQEYADRDLEPEEHFYEAHGRHDPRWDTDLSSMLPRLDGYGAEYVYIINLDQEVLTMNYGIHWKLGNIQRKDDLWMQAIADSIYPDHPTISLDVCPEEHVASTALELPEPDSHISYPSSIVTPRARIEGAREAFLTRALSGLFLEYRNDIIRFGREWAPDSLIFRELAFALVSMASGQASFHASPPTPPMPIYSHSPSPPEWYDQDWAGDTVPQVEFGSFRHRPGQPPGVSPPETMYWHEDVLVSLVLVVDGAAISKAVAWGISQARENFQVVVMSLFEVAFAEVSILTVSP